MYKGKEWFIREVAKRADFTIEDVRCLWDTMQEVIFDVTVETVRELEKNPEAKGDAALTLGGILSYNITKIRPHTAFDASRRKRIEVGNTYRYVFRASRKFANMIKNELKNLRSEE